MSPAKKPTFAKLPAKKLAARLREIVSTSSGDDRRFQRDMDTLMQAAEMIESEKKSTSAGLRAGKQREITITLPIGLADNLAAVAGGVFSESVEEHIVGLLRDHNADVIEGRRVSEIIVTTRYFKTRAAAKLAAEKADLFDGESNSWTFNQDGCGWYAKFKDMR